MSSHRRNIVIRPDMIYKRNIVIRQDMKVSTSMVQSTTYQAIPSRQTNRHEHNFFEVLACRYSSLSLFIITLLLFFLHLGVTLHYGTLVHNL